VVSFKPLLLYPRGKSSGTHWKEGCMGPIDSLDDMHGRREIARRRPLLTYYVLNNQISSYVFSLAYYIGDSILKILFSGICNVMYV
jgi:hypothetical protein